MELDFDTKWIVEGLAGRSRTGAQLYAAKCSTCGVSKANTKSNLQRTNACKSCSASVRNTKHGYFGTRIYQQWADMHRRCSNVKYHDYLSYGGRGISVCPIDELPQFSLLMV